ncbi:MAG: hypothetical protein FWE25_07055 [Lachnospiraceae bacterium]|nr:hypothetical protein [Lachnospiraceae bacterium]
MAFNYKQYKQNKKIKSLEEEFGKECYLREVTILLGDKRMATRDENMRRRAIHLAELVDRLDIKETEIKGIVIREAADFVVDSHYLPSIVRLIKMYDSLDSIKSNDPDKNRVKEEILVLIDDIIVQLERAVKKQDDAKLADIGETVKAMSEVAKMNQRL